MWPRNLSPAYDRLRDGPDGDPENRSSSDAEQETKFDRTRFASPPRGRFRQAGEVLFAMAGVLCLWIALVAAWRTTLHPTTLAAPRYERQTLTCGNTTEEAEARGCVFDLLSHNWLPAPCMDYEVTAEFKAYARSPERAWGAWPYFTDRTGRDRIKDEYDLSHVGDRLVVSTLEEHLAHCDFLIRRIHRAGAGITKLDGYISGLPHTTHCIDMLRNPSGRDLASLSEGFWVGFSDCTVEVLV